MTYTLWHGDCLEEMDRIEAGSIDAVICDLPYNVTNCHWDTLIPFEPLWKQYKRVIKKNGAVVLFGSEPFSSLLVVSNLEWFKYEWMWRKNVGSNFLNANKEPMKEHESILVFGKGRITYNEQRIERKDKKRGLYKDAAKKRRNGEAYGYYDFPEKNGRPETRCPSSVLEFNRQVGLHPTQKPVALLSYLIKTYTNEGETVLDNTCGSGSTLEAAMRTGRHSIGIEKDAHYFSVATQRLACVAAELRGELNHLPMFAEVAPV